jgi:phage shock protein PspC (stress-responsive transcriptional regulator)
MNKTVSVNISGFIFNIEETAFEKLNRYLNTIRGYFSESSGAEEIIEDIEARIAELFQEKISENYQVIKLKDVNEVIETMGQPEEYIDSDISDDDEPKQRSTEYSTGPRNKYRKIYRDPDDKVLGGVCTGIGYYFGIDPIWVRLFFIILLLGFGTGVLLYIILWIIIPMAKTPSEKLEMKGNPVTAENIGKQVEEEMENLKKKFKNFKEGSVDDHKSQLSSGVGDFFNFLAKLLKLLFSSLGKVLGFLFVLLGLTVIVALFFSLGTSGEFLGYHSNFNDFVLSYPELVDLIPEGLINTGWLSTFAILTIGIPFLALTFLGFNMLTNFVYKIRGLGVALFIIWFIASISAVFYVGSIAKDYVHEYDEKSTYQLEQILGDTLVVEVMTDDIYSEEKARHFNDLDFIKVIGDRIYLGNPELDIEKSKTDEFQLIIYKESRGRNRGDALENARAIEYDYMELGNLISFSPFYSISKENGYHFENIRLRLLVPEGKAVLLQNGSERIIYDIENVTNTYDLNMVGKVWTMTSRGLECIECDPDDL